jgi:glucose-6-phosphate 1-dehydrogenase
MRTFGKFTLMTLAITPHFDNPLDEGLASVKAAAPCIMVIFGATGDLTARRLVPALYNLARDGQLPHHFCCVGFARRDKDDAQFRSEMQVAVQQHSRVQPIDVQLWETFSQQLFYHRANFSDDHGYDTLKTRLQELDAQFGTRGNRVFYLSTQPHEFLTIVEKLNQHGLLYPVEQEARRWSRVILEKPFGHDLASAIALQQQLSKFMHESQCYRIDHWLGKETVQNLLVFRFTNPLFESVWNNHHIDHIQISVAEDIGIGTRGNLWEQAGMLRDIVQNHVMQLTSLIAMEPPANLKADSIRDEKVKVLESIRPFTSDDLRNFVVRGQYGPGFIQGQPVKGYRQEENVSPASIVETYVALRLQIDNWRWAGVPFYIRAGKRLPKRATEIAITFKEAPGMLYKLESRRQQANVLVMHIQPNEGILLKMNCKVPGHDSTIQPVGMEFKYGSYFGATPPEAYERLICDCMAGDSTLFARDDEVMASWSLLTPILEDWQDSAPPILPNYAAGLWGPPEAEQMMEREGRAWRLL